MQVSSTISLCDLHFIHW